MCFLMCLYTIFGVCLLAFLAMPMVVVKWWPIHFGKTVCQNGNECPPQNLFIFSGWQMDLPEWQMVKWTC